MTLILYIPYKDGAIVMADRQATIDQLREPTKKLSLHCAEGPLFAGAGENSNLIDLIISKIKTKKNINNKNVIKEFEKVVNEEYSNKKYIQDSFSEIEFLIVHYDNSRKLTYFNNFIPVEKPFESPFAIGSGKPIILKHLDLITKKFEKEDAIIFGLTLLGLASYSLTGVDVNTYGCELVIINKNNFVKKKINPRFIDFEPVCYNFEKAKKGKTKYEEVEEDE